MADFKKFHIKDLGQQEEIIAVIHRNWFYLFTQYVAILLMTAVLVLGFVFVPKVFPVMGSGEFRLFFLFAENVFTLALWIMAFLIWIDYYFDVWIITSERIINVEQKGMFSRRVSELSYAKIQDITTEVLGFLPSMLNYGDVYVQTAGEQERFIFRTVSDPYHIKNLIAQQQQRAAKTGKPF